MKLTLDLPEDISQLHLPHGVAARLQRLLDQQDSGKPLAPEEFAEAEGLVSMADFLTLLRLRTMRMLP